MLDGGAHFYGTYETNDGEHIALGSIEPQFYAQLVEKAGLDAEDFSAQMDQSRWPEFQEKLTACFLTKTRSEWQEIMEGTDVCFAPVLSIEEVADHPHNKARGTFQNLEGVVQPAPAPRFSRTPVALTHGSRSPGSDTELVLQEAGFDEASIAGLLESGAVATGE
jgi:alpha-methylacyl-CoA racemase